MMNKLPVKSPAQTVAESSLMGYTV